MTPGRARGVAQVQEGTVCKKAFWAVSRKDTKAEELGLVHLQFGEVVQS